MDIMGNNEGSIDRTLQERGNVYGSYRSVIVARAQIIDILNEHYKLRNGEDMSLSTMLMFQDIVLKLVRAASSPHYQDSWHDIAGYAKLIEEVVGNDN